MNRLSAPYHAQIGRVGTPNHELLEPHACFPGLKPQKWVKTPFALAEASAPTPKGVGFPPSKK
jgi:hypothetical protein